MIDCLYAQRRLLCVALIACLAVVRPSTLAAQSLTADFTYPAAGATTVDFSQPLQWTTIAGAQAYYLYLGTTLGAKDLVNTGEIQQTSYHLPSSVPADQILYVRLWTKAGGVWRYVDTTFRLFRL